MSIRRIAWIAALCWGVVGAPALGAAQDLTCSAKIDRTTVTVAEPVTLTLTMAGDLEGARLADLRLPEGISIAAQSQSTNIAIRSGAMERSTHLTYMLVPQQAGTFQLGPFTVVRQGKEFQTEAIELTVEKSALPPPSKQQPEGVRYFL